MAAPIQYLSTNRRLAGGERPPFTGRVGLREALFTGLAPDGGLFMPDALPVHDAAFFDDLRGRPYPEVAFRLLRPFTTGVLDDDVAAAIAMEAYPFEVPLEPAGDRRYLLRLDRGPTASFKDFAARWMARVMTALRPAGDPMTVLVATSGDTGSAVGEAFRGLENTRVFLLYPEREVSAIQRRQLDTIGENVQALALDGTFDDCQALVKRAFLDADLAPRHLTSANSINIGRILPQSVYYSYAYTRLDAPGPVTFSVPSGNLGNAFGAELARRMGLPLARLILAVNANDEVPRFLATGAYRPVVPSRACLSNAMNVGNPSNLARFFDLYGGTVTREGVVRTAPDLARMRADLVSVPVSDADTTACMRRAWAERRILLEPHGAVGWVALDRAGAAEGSTAVCLETAHPAKFADIVEAELGFAPEPPPSMRDLAQRPGAAVRMPADYATLKEYLVSHEMD